MHLEKKTNDMSMSLQVDDDVSSDTATINHINDKEFKSLEVSFLESLKQLSPCALRDRAVKDASGRWYCLVLFGLVCPSFFVWICREKWDYVLSILKLALVYFGRDIHIPAKVKSLDHDFSRTWRYIILNSPATRMLATSESLCKWASKDQSSCLARSIHP